jgi:hypothetical protein
MIPEGQHLLKRRSIVEFFLLEFITVFVTLTIIQLAGHESYSPEVAGFVGGIAAVIGSGLFWRTESKRHNKSIGPAD